MNAYMCKSSTPDYVPNIDGKIVVANSLADAATCFSQYFQNIRLDDVALVGVDVLIVKYEEQT